jgi:hypothetical protein
LRAEVLVAFAHRHLEAADGAFGDFRRGDQFGDHRAHRLLVGAQALEAAIQQHAVTDCQQKKNRNKAFDHKSE